ncbi:hypothetical protein BRADI_2g36250v3 [Brachypodium distachyon]|uniref:F-box domain-containing protein n=1 Tax=Brachypodium distachyon TaxID=15368 RepID=A0A2K2DC33_BRADI|nr:hypothetical protein BRADI_2g36250v3 [Brachypodium distachyon]
MAGPPSSKRQRTADPALATSRIEGLTTDLLLRVMSNLDARLAVQICVLFPCFRDLWRSLPCINATCEEFEDDEGIVNEVSFKAFINRFLARRESVGIDRFRLCYSIVGGPGTDLEACYVDANDWIRHALEHDARIVELENHSEPLELDPDVFTSKCLETLHIGNATLVEGFFEQLEHGCPGLKDLVLTNCMITDHEISSPTLELLTVQEELGFVHDDRLFLKGLSGVTRLTFYYGHRKVSTQ